MAFGPYPASQQRDTWFQIRKLRLVAIQSINVNKKKPSSFPLTSEGELPSLQMKRAGNKVTEPSRWHHTCHSFQMAAVTRPHRCCAMGSQGNTLLNQNKQELLRQPCFRCGALPVLLAFKGITLQLPTGLQHDKG